MKLDEGDIKDAIDDMLSDKEVIFGFDSNTTTYSLNSYKLIERGTVVVQCTYEENGNSFTRSFEISKSKLRNIKLKKILE
jgi:NADPH:quinone reductase-like Zn-dependent oxidoreductase